MVRGRVTGRWRLKMLFLEDDIFFVLMSWVVLFVFIWLFAGKG